MPIHDFNAQRLFIDAPLVAGARISANPDQANYLRNVLRLGDGDQILIFNGRDGEWIARLAIAGKRGLDLIVGELNRPQEGGPDIDYLFAPLKRSRLDYMVQKATEMGVARLCPVLTRHTQAERVNTERMRGNAIEAAEQCGILRVPEVAEPQKLEKVLQGWDPARTLIFCDEGAEVSNPIEALSSLYPSDGSGPPPPSLGRDGGRVGEWGPHNSHLSLSLSFSLPPPLTLPRQGEGNSNHSLAVLIGPEGGFSKEERELLLSKPYTVRISLGPRIMRADTAAVAALALVNAVLGDWR